jgi:glycine C-acetyltransferase
MNELESRLKEANTDGARFKLIVTDGVFSMDGYVANLPAICDLAERYGAMVMVDDCHATGHLGPEGKGTPALTGVDAKVDIVTGTLGKTLGGAMGGFIAASQPIIDLMRQRARPYLFSNSLAPAVASGSLKAIEIARKADDRRVKLMRTTKRFRDGMTKAGFELLPGDTPIIPVMLGDAKLATQMANQLLAQGTITREAGAKRLYRFAVKEGISKGKPDEDFWQALIQTYRNLDDRYITVEGAAGDINAAAMRRAAAGH